MSLRVDVLSIFPRLFDAFLDESFPGQAVKSGALEAQVHDLRDWTSDRHRSVDDSPYGGGPGMVMTPEPLVSAIEELAGPKGPERRAQVVALSPQGRRLNQAVLGELSAQSHLVLVCGRYEGIDERVYEIAVDEVLSIGDYVLSGGEIPAMAVIEGVVRLLPGVLGNPESVRWESFSEGPVPAQGKTGPAGDFEVRGGVLEGPQYTRPPSFRGHTVPDVLRSGDHAAIEKWRRERAREVTATRRPDLLEMRDGDQRDRRGEKKR